MAPNPNTITSINSLVNKIDDLYDEVNKHLKTYPHDLHAEFLKILLLTFYKASVNKDKIKIVVESLYSIADEVEK